VAPSPEIPTSPSADDAAANAAAARPVAAWLSLLSRTCKTCRLYDAGNPAVVRFREDLYRALCALLEPHDEIELEVSSRELSFAGTVVYRSVSREDNLAGVFHRDGIRRLTLQKGIGADELESLLDLILQVTGRAAAEEDLVTLLWERQLPHVAVAAAPQAGDMDGGGDEGGGGPCPMPWPAAGSPANRGAPAPAGAPWPGARPGPEQPERSDDFELFTREASPEGAYAELERVAVAEMERLQDEYQAESARPAVTRALETLADCLSCEITPADRRELAAFVPRVLREALVAGDWPAARDALAMLRACDAEAAIAMLFEGLSSESTVGPMRRMVATLDGQGAAGVEAFLALATDIGAPGADWLMRVLAESQEQRTRRPLARALAKIVTPCPERLVRWLADERWYVVRNVVHILGWIGGDRIAGHLETALHHPDARVRREVVATLGTVSPETSRPILLGMLAVEEARLFTLVVQQLTVTSDPVVAQRLQELLRDERFLARGEDERRAVYRGLASQGESVLGTLEQELDRGGLFARGLDEHRRSVARCIARIGTPAARAALERGARSFTPGTRKACEQALGALGAADE